MNETTTKAVLNESTLTAIAEAIREKSSSTAALKPSEMPEAIKNIKGGGDGYIYMINGTNSDDWPDELIYDGGNTKKSHSDVYINILRDKGAREHESMFSWFIRRTSDTFIYVIAVLER